MVNQHTSLYGINKEQYSCWKSYIGEAAFFQTQRTFSK